MRVRFGLTLMHFHYKFLFTIHCLRARVSTKLLASLLGWSPALFDDITPNHTMLYFFIGVIDRLDAIGPDRMCLCVYRTQQYCTVCTVAVRYLLFTSVLLSFVSA